MFGWEFPPHITGGLGTACFGLVKGLGKHGVDVIFVVPKAYGDEAKEGFRLVNASDMVLDFSKTVYQEHWNRIKFMEIGSNLVPYVGPEEFEKMVQEESMKLTGETQSVFSERYQFSGKYGHKLMEEVSRYAIVASVIAQQTTYDVIHTTGSHTPRELQQKRSAASRLSCMFMQPSLTARVKMSTRRYMTSNNREWQRQTS
jgi:glycogen(starch) synthase